MPCSGTPCLFIRYPLLITSASGLRGALFGSRLLILVTWRDAWFDFDEPDPQDVREDYLVRTVGFVVAQNARFMSLAQELLPDGDGYRAVTHIPLASVETVENLKVG